MEPGEVEFNWTDSFCNNGQSDALSNYKGAPKITHNSCDSSKIRKGDDWEWSVRIKGLKPLTVELYHGCELRHEETYNGDMTMFEVTIYKVKAADAGSYELFVSNDNGEVRVSHELVVKRR